MDFIINSAGLLNIKLLKEKTDAEIFDEISINYIGWINVAKTDMVNFAKTISDEWADDGILVNVINP